MAIINFGSINIDHVYQVAEFVQPGETIASHNYQQLLGGKGANQSIALAKAGSDVKHVGRLHESDATFKQAMIKQGVDCRYVTCSDTPSGHAIIQVSDAGENAIVLFGGANQQIQKQDVLKALDKAQEGDWVLMQNETSAIDEAMRQAKEKGLKVAFNPAPMTPSVKALPLECIDLLIVNEHEAAEMSGESDIAAMETFFTQQMSGTEVIITLGKAGARMLSADNNVKVDAFVVDAIDTTAAGDTFIGYFLSAYSQGVKAEEALIRGCAASAISVTQMGAAQSIPSAQQVDAFLANQ